MNETVTAPSLASRFPDLDPDFARLLDAAGASGQPPMFELDAGDLRQRVSAGDQLCSAGPEMLDVIDSEPEPGVPVRRWLGT